MVISGAAETARGGRVGRARRSGSRTSILDRSGGSVKAGAPEFTRAAGENIHAAERRLGRNLASEHREADPTAEELL